MAGGTGELLTGTPGGRLRNGDVVARAAGARRTTAGLSTPSGEARAAYLATGDPPAAPCALPVDGLGGWFVEGVAGDRASVIGISLPLTRRLLAEVGVSVPHLWSESAPR